MKKRSVAGQCVLGVLAFLFLGGADDEGGGCLGGKREGYPLLPHIDITECVERDTAAQFRSK